MNKQKPAYERFLNQISPEPNTGCWLWTGAVRNTYGTLRDGKPVLAHRWSWIHENGPIPAGLVIDHICRVRLCVNPRHLRVVTCRENLMAVGSLVLQKINAEKTHCKNGHPFSPENTYYVRQKTKYSYRLCRTCNLAHQRKMYQQRRQTQHTL